MASPLVPNIGQALQQGGNFGQQIANNLRQRRMDESGAKAAQEKSRILGQQRMVNNVASEANAALQIEDSAGLKSYLVRRAQEVTANPVDGLNAADFIDMANRLGDENGFNTVTQELKADLARAQDIDAAIKQKFGGGATGVQQAVNVPGVGFKALTREGQVKLIQLPEADQKIVMDAFQADAERKAKAAGLKAETVAGVELETKPEITSQVETAKRTAQEETAAGIKEQEGLGAEAGRTASTITKSANTARRTRPKVAAVRRALDGIATGKIAQVKVSLGPFIPGLDVSNEQVMQSQITQFVLDTLNQQSGTKTDFDFKKASEASASLGKTTEANKAILDILIKNLDRSIEEQKQFKSFRKGGGKALDFEFKDETPAATRRIRFDAQGNIIQ